MASMDEEFATGAPLEVGDLVASSFRAIGDRPGPLFALASIVTVPSAIVGLVLQIAQYHVTRDLMADPSGSATALLAVFSLVTVAVAIITSIASTLIQGAIMRLTVEQVRGRMIGAGEALRLTVPRFWALVGAGFLMALAVGVGTLLCLVPGVLAYVWLIAAMPAAANEEIGPIEALQRSIDLTEGSRLTIFFLGVLLTVALAALWGCVVTPSFALGGMDAIMRGEAAIDPLAPAQLVTHVLSMFLQLAMVVVFAVTQAVVYAKLRGLREQVDASSVAKVFA